MTEKLRQLRLAALAMLLASGNALAQVSDDVVKIGVINDMSGLAADFGGKGSLLAAQMAAQDFGGKVLGKPIVVIGADHQNKADIASSVVRKWIDVEQVDVIADVTNSAVALAVQELVREKKRLAIFSGASTSALTQKACSPFGIHWTYDTYAFSRGLGSGLVRDGKDTWYFITMDLAFGQQLQKDTTDVIEAAGGKVLGSVRHPLSTADFGSFLLQAQASKAKVVGLATAGSDLINVVKQADEFGLRAGGQTLIPMVTFITDVHGIGLKAMQGAYVVSAYYWDMNEEGRAFAKRFQAQHGAPPTMNQAGVYTSLTHYLKSVAAVGSDDAEKVRAHMGATPINDFMTKGGRVRPDGRVEREMFLFQVKAPAESKAPWDYYRLVRRLSPEETVWPLSDSVCPLVKKS